MKSLTKILAGLSLATALSFITSTALAEIAIVTHPATKEIGLSSNHIAEIYLGKVKTFKNGTRIKPVDQAKGSPLRIKFYKAVMKKSENEINRYWSKRKYSGKGKPPVSIHGNQAVKEYIANNPGAIGYVEGKFLDSSVKVVLIIP